MEDQDPELTVNPVAVAKMKREKEKAKAAAKAAKEAKGKAAKEAAAMAAAQRSAGQGGKAALATSTSDPGWIFEHPKRPRLKVLGISISRLPSGVKKDQSSIGEVGLRDFDAELVKRNEKADAARQIELQSMNIQVVDV